jgi:hypothetical protein
MNPTPSQPECGGKKRYSKKEAQKAKRFVGKRIRKDMRIYLCPHCHGYHLTKRYGKYD